MSVGAHVLHPRRPALRRNTGGFAGALLLILAVAGGTAGIALVVRLHLDAASQTVAWPIGVMLLTVLSMLLVIRARDRRASYFEIGVVFAGIVLLYGAYPPFVAALSHFEFGPTKDGRFVGAPPLPSEMASIAWWYAIYLAAFCAAYLVVRPRQSAPSERPKPPGRAVPIAAAILLAVAKLYGLAISFAYGFHGRTYSEQYIVARNIPIVWRQISNIFDGMEITLQIILLASLFCYYRRTKWIILSLVVVIVVATIVRRGARTDMVIAVMGALQLRDQLIKRLSAKAIAIAGVAGFTLYLAMGVLRLENRELRLPTMDELTGTYTDFEGIFANAYDLKYLLGASGAFRGHWSVLLADIAAVVPQQLLPIQKTSASDWYVKTYYPLSYSQGGGFAFGAVAEAIVGYGLPELVLRGMFVGLFLALLHRRYAAGRVGWILLTFYVWQTIMVYQICRITTLSVISTTLYRFVPAVAATILLAAAMRRGRRRLLA